MQRQRWFISDTRICFNKTNMTYRLSVIGERSLRISYEVGVHAWFAESLIAALLA